MEDRTETREPDFGAAEDRVADIDGTESPDSILDSGAADEPDRTPAEAIREVVRDHPVAGAMGALTGAIGGTIVAGAPGTVVGAATGAARGVVVAEAAKKIGERLESANLLDPEDNGAIARARGA